MNSDCIVFHEESENSINDSTGTPGRVPGLQHWIDRMAYRHDMTSADFSATAEPATNDNGGEQIPNSRVKGNVTFVDGHAETVTRRFTHSKEHAVPDPDAAANMANPAYK